MKKPRKKENNSTKNRSKLLEKLCLIIYLFILIITFFKVYNDVFDKKINLGGDNASYYILGNSIASGQGYTNIHFKEKTFHRRFPPGYPLIIACASKLFSNNIQFIKKVNGFFFLLSIGFLFFVFHKLTGNYHIPFITCLFLLMNYHLLSYSVIMMSEIPFLFFSTLCIWLLLKINFTLPLRKNWLFFVLLVCISFTYYIRSMGLSLFAGVALFLLLKRNWKYLFSLVVGFILLALPWYLKTKSVGGSSYVNALIQKNPYRPELGQMELIDWVKRFWNNLERYITREIPSGTFNFIEVANYKAPISYLEWIVGISIALVILFGLIRLKKFSCFFIFYIVASFGILLLWPNVWYGIRFVLPLIPLLSFLFIHGVVEFLTWFGQKVLKTKSQSLIHIALVILCLITIRSYVKKPLEKLKQQAKNSYSNNFKNYFELANWVKKNTPDTSITCCRKTGLFYLYSNKYVTGYANTLDKEKQIKTLQKKNVDYVVLEQLGYSSTGRYLYPAIKRYPRKFKIIQHLKNPDTYLMKFMPELDYWGEWKDNKRSGKGTYAWENGLKFEGMWKDNLRNGAGKLYFTNGQQLEGVWTNDTLNGVTILRSKEGDIIEKSIYKNNVKIKVIK